LREVVGKERVCACYVERGRGAHQPVRARVTVGTEQCVVAAVCVMCTQHQNVTGNRIRPPAPAGRTRHRLDQKVGRRKRSARVAAGAKFKFLPLSLVKV
jgi:hypothetical protein